MSQAKLTLTSDDRDVQKAMDKLIAKNEKLEQKLHDVKKASQGQSNEAKKGSDNWMKSLGGIVTQYASIGAAINAVNEKMQRQIELQGKLGSQASNLASAQLDFFGNTANLSPAEQKAAYQKLVQANKDSGFGNLDAFIRASSAAASTTGADVGVLVPAMFEAGRFSNGNEDNAREIGAGTAKIMQITGEKDARRAMGLMLTVQPQSDIRDVSKLGVNLPPVIASGMANKLRGTAQETAIDSAASFAYLTGAGDKEGNASRTQAIKLENALNDFFPDDATDPGTLRSRLETISKGGRGMQDKFLKQLPVEELFKTRIEGLVRGDKDAWAQFDKIRGGLKFDAGKVDEQNLLRDTATPELVRESRLNQFRANAAAADMAQSPMAMLDAERQILNKIIEDADTQGITGYTEGFDRWFAQAPGRFWGSPAKQSQDMIDQAGSLVARQAGIRNPQGMPGFEERFIDDLPYQKQVLSGLPADQQDLVRANLEMLEEMKGLRQDIQAQTAQQKKPTVSPQGMQEAN